MDASRCPVIVIGMHRSGTTLLTRALQQAGLFMGPGPVRNEEARFTNAINAWLFRQASASWDRPESFDWLLADDLVRSWLTDYVAGVVNGPAAVRFLGPRRWLRYRGLHGMAEPWGWKDPRNTYTLPLWLAMFPDARVIHIARHGVDVAASLRARRRAEVADSLERYRRRRTAYRRNPLAPKRRGFGGQARCATLAGGFDLWTCYIDRAREHCACLGGRALELAYEDFLADPRGEIERLLGFCGLELSPADADAIVQSVDADRAQAHRRDPELAAFADGVAEPLARRGYTPEGGPADGDA